MDEPRIGPTVDLPACHLFTIGQEFYAYNLDRQQLVAVDPELAALLRGDDSGTDPARRALRTAREEEGLFHSHRLRLTPRPRPAAEETDQGLRHLVLTLTEDCNLRCAYCLHGAKLPWVREHGRGLMSPPMACSAVQYFLDRCDPGRTPMISLYGGEALLNREVVAAVVAATRRHRNGRKATIAIDTNGVLLDGAAIEFVIRENIHLQVSLDGPAPIHDRYRRDTADNPTFDRIHANIGRLLDRDPLAADRLTYMVTLVPPIDLAAVADFFLAFPPHLERGIMEQPHVSVNFANLSGQKWGQGQEEATEMAAVSVQLAQARAHYLEAVATRKRLEISPVIRAIFEPELIRIHHRSRAPLGEFYSPGANCRPGRRKLHVGVDGRLQPCERTGNVMSLGSIDSGISIRDVEKLDERFHSALGNRCGQCWALRLCGVCFAVQAENSDRTTGEFPIPESVCRAVRLQKEDSLKLLVQVLAMEPAAREWLDRTELDS
jgi:uncharacterized protein